MSDFQKLKLAILEVLPVSKDALHLHLGLLVFTAVLLLLRQRRSPWLAWAATLLVALTLEALDLRDDRRSLGTLRWTASIHDLINTLIWPTVLALLIRFKVLLPRASAPRSRQ